MMSRDGGKGRRNIFVPKRVLYVFLLAVFLAAVGNHVIVSYAEQGAAGAPVIGPTKFERLKSLYQKNLFREIERYGYYAEDWAGDTASLTSVQNYGQYMTAIVPFAYLVDQQGNLKGNISETVLSAAREKNLQVFALVHNFHNGAFDRTLISSVLNNENSRKNLVDSIYNVIKSKGLAGVNIDFENIKGADREKFNLFLSELKEKLKTDGSLVTISVPAKTWDDPANSWSGGFDYKHIGNVADRVMLMTYDEHWFGGTPGPVASLPWVDSVVKYAVSQMPKEKILVGIGTYGYDWSPGKTKVVTSAKAVPLAKRYGANILWDSTAQVPYYNYWLSSQKHEVWFESTESAALKANLVKKYQIRGIAVWRLGFEDGVFWENMMKTLGK